MFLKCRTESLEENVITQIIADLGLDRRDFKGTWNLLANAIAEHNGRRRRIFGTLMAKDFQSKAY